MDINKLVETLKRYFEKRDEILMVFLFGSFTKGTSRGLSDIDIAIYFRPESGSLEWEEFDARYGTEDEISLDLERLLNRNVDLIVLNRARASIASSAIRGVPIVIKDRGLYLDYMLRVTAEAEDYREMVEDYWKIKRKMHG